MKTFSLDLETLAPTTSTQKQRGTVKCNSAATFCFTEQKISRGKKSHSEKPICKLVLSKSVEHYCNKVLYGLKRSVTHQNRSLWVNINKDEVRSSSKPENSLNFNTGLAIRSHFSKTETQIFWYARGLDHISIYF